MTAAPSHPPDGRRYLSLALPYLSTDRIHRRQLGRRWRSAAPPEAPLATVAKVKSALRLAALDARGEELGLRCGMALADARAMIPSLEAIEEDSSADCALLETLADWAERYTPLVAFDLPDGLMLDVTGATHLFGGEEALIADLVARLNNQGFLARAAIADTPGAASATARFGTSSVVPLGEAEALLKPLPLAALRLDNETVAAMDRVGLKRIGQIVGAPRGPLAARFGTTLIRRLDQALGLEEESISPRRPVPALIAERRFAEPIAREEDVSATLLSLAATLAQNLEARGEGARALELSLFRVDGHVARTTIGTSRPVRAPKLVLDLFREKFSGLGEDFDAGFGFDMIRLAVVATASADAAQIDLTGEASGEADLDQLIDRIGARLGEGHVGRIFLGDSHVPERAAVFVAPEEALPPPLIPTEHGFTRVQTIGDEVGNGRLRVAGTQEQHTLRPETMAPGFPLAAGMSGVWVNLGDSITSHPNSSGPIDRPLRLFARPEPVEAVAEVPDGPPVRFLWRRAIYRIARAEGPERIASEWWRNDDELTRDYFRVEDLDGHRFWLFREGLYGRETTAPRWYLHGLFA